MRAEYPGLSLRDFFRRPAGLTYQELVSLIMNLPPGCALDRAVRGEAADWTTSDYLLARLFNVTLQAHSEKRVSRSDLILPPGTDRSPLPKKEKSGGFKELDAMFTGG